MKRLSIIILSFLVLNAGVAWALESCLHLHAHLHQSDSSSIERHWADGLPFSDSDSEDRLDSDPHCIYFHLQLDPGISMPTTQAGLFAGGIALNGPALPESLAPNLWSTAVFRRVSSFPSLSGLSHYLFFSVLRI